MVAKLWVTSAVARAHARRRGRGLAAGMAAADDDDIEALAHGPYLIGSRLRVKAAVQLFHVNQVERPALFADAELGEDGAEHLLDIDPAGEPAEMAGGDAKLLGLELGARARDRRSAQARLARPRARPGGGSGSGAARLRPDSAARAAFSASVSTSRPIPSPVLAETSRPSLPAPALGARSILFNTVISAPLADVCAISACDKLRRRVPLRRGGIDQPQHEIGVPCPRQCPPDPLGLDLAFGLAQARGVDQHDRHAAEIEMNLDDVARGARLLRHDRHVALGERIQQSTTCRHWADRR